MCPASKIWPSLYDEWASGSILVSPTCSFVFHFMIQFIPFKCGGGISTLKDWPQSWPEIKCCWWRCLVICFFLSLLWVGVAWWQVTPVSCQLNRELLLSLRTIARIPNDKAPLLRLVVCANATDASRDRAVTFGQSGDLNATSSS